MVENRRRKVRRDSDRLLEKILNTLRVIERLSEGEEEEEFTEHYADLVGLMHKMGRRQRDHKIGEAICTTFEAVANNLHRLLEKQGRKRKVKLVKVSGSGEPEAPIVGWELLPPDVGKRYLVFDDKGSVYSTSPITMITDGQIHTRHSVYEIEVLE